MAKRYVVKPEFFDPDFEMNEDGRRFRMRANALANWTELEGLRKTLRINNWHWVVIDTKTGERLTP